LILLGYGKTTQAIAEIFNIQNIYDDKEMQNSQVIHTSNFPENIESEIIPTPAIPPNHWIIQKFSEKILSEYDIFYQKAFFPFTIWVSGTNGKTTTTEMITYLLNHRFAVSGGNIGIPLGKLDKKASIWVLETSSFTLHYTKLAKPNLYVLLPITEDHISWHGSFEEYEKSKLKPIQNLEEGEVAIIPDKYKNIETDGYLITYKDSKDLAKKLNLDISKIHFKGGFLLDSILALAVSKILFDEVDYSKINSFQKSPHRQEQFLDFQNRVWINDSKATNPDSTISILDSFSHKKILLILGGEDKKADWNLMFKEFQKLDIHLFLIGKSVEKAEKLAQKFNIEYNISNKMDIAISQISLLHNLDSVAILSPASASFDQFKSYEDRGDYFKKVVNEEKEINKTSGKSI